MSLVLAAFAKASHSFWITTIVVLATMFSERPGHAQAGLAGFADPGFSTAIGVTLGLATVGVGAYLTTTHQRYTSENRQAIRTALARGSGSFVSDIVAYLGLPQSSAADVGGALRRARGELDPLLRAPRTEDGGNFIAATIDALRRDPEIGLQVAAALATQKGDAGGSAGIGPR